MITNYERINKKVLQNTKSSDIMNNVIGNTVKKEQDLPESLKGNAQWLKNLYGELNSVKPVGISEKKKLESLLSDFNTEAENIGKLDARTRELPHIQEYMKNKYNKSHIFGSSAGILGSQGNVKSQKTPALQSGYPKSTLQNSPNWVINAPPIKSIVETPDFLEEKDQFEQEISSDKITNFSFNEKEFYIPPEERDVNKDESPYYGLIKNQNNPEMADRYLKDAPVSDVGCEAIAIHNILFMLDGKGKDFNDVLKRCEKIRYPSPFPFTRRGAFGCVPQLMWRVFDEFGVNYTQYTKYNDAYASIKSLKTDDIFVVSYWNDGKVLNGLHTVAVKVKEIDGKQAYEVININGIRTYYSWESFVTEQMGTSDGFITLYKIEK